VRRLAVVNHKGGTGKTTTAVNLSAALAELGKSVLLVDLDPQGSATRWLDPLPAEGEAEGEAEVDHGDLPSRVLEGSLPVMEAVDAVGATGFGFDRLPGNASLRRAARALAGEPASDASLRGVLRGLPQGRYDFVVIDCPPHEGFLSANALVAADALVIPVETRVLALQGLASLIAKIRRLGVRLERELPIAAILACRLDRRTSHAPWVAETIREYCEAEFPGVPVLTVRENVALSDAAAARMPVTVFRPGSAGAEDYRGVGRVVQGEYSG
jgi:chromosome partitioning protein